MKGKMKNLLTLLLFVILVGSSAAAELDILDVESFAQAGGVKSKLNDHDVYLVLFGKKEWAQVNIARKLANRRSDVLDTVNRDPWVNRQYLSDYLQMVRTLISEQTGKQPTREEVFVAWQVGFKAFKKADFDVKKVKGLDEKLHLFRALSGVQVQASFRSQPPPLPLNPVPPPNYRGEWPREDELRRNLR
jgi:hypothetical protein